MTVLKVRIYGDEVLRQKSKEVAKISKKINTLVENMFATLYTYDGVGLAAPQIGENLRIFILDLAESGKPRCPMVFINPKIIKKSGAVNSYEGCLSFPEAYMNVRRYKNVTVKALNLHGKPFIIEAKDGDLLSRAIQHEFDHLEGKLFIDHARNRFEADEILHKNNLNPIDTNYLLEENELEEEIAKQPKEDNE